MLCFHETLLLSFQWRLKSRRGAVSWFLGNDRRLPFSVRTRLLRLARIPSIEKEINRRVKGLIKFYDRRRYAGAYGRIIYDISSSLRDPRDQSWWARVLPLLSSFCHSCTPGCTCTPAIVSRPDENNRCRKSQTASLSFRDSPSPTPLLWRRCSLEFRTESR